MLVFLPLEMHTFNKAAPLLLKVKILIELTKITQNISVSYFVMLMVWSRDKKFYMGLLLKFFLLLKLYSSFESMKFERK